MFTGQLPLAEYAREATVIMRVREGKRPVCPSRSSPPWTERGLTESIWVLMEDCWKHRPQDRPTIARVVERLDYEKPTDLRPTDDYPATSPMRFRNATHRANNGGTFTRGNDPEEVLEPQRLTPQISAQTPGWNQMVRGLKRFISRRNTVRK